MRQLEERDASWKSHWGLIRYARHEVGGLTPPTGGLQIARENRRLPEIRESALPTTVVAPYSVDLKGEAGNPAELYKFTSGLSSQP